MFRIFNKLSSLVGTTAMGASYLIGFLSFLPTSTFSRKFPEKFPKIPENWRKK